MEAVTSTTHDRRAQEHRHDDNHNRRESVALFASGMLDVEGSPLGSMPSTPTPHNRDRNQKPDLTAPTRIQWPETQPSTTPTRPRYQHTTESIDQGSTTPRVTARDRPMTFSPYTSSQAPTSIAPSTAGATKPTSGVTSTLSPRHQNLRATRKGSFLELDVDQDYQDVVTPPSTLQFSIPESRLATTPRSVIAKSRVDRILMKDGLVIPQPIFVREDEEALETGHRRNSSSEQNIGSSRKRNLDGELLSSDQSQFQSKERLLASPRKMASVQDFLGISGIGSVNPSRSQPAESLQGANDEEEEEEESDSDGRQSPSRRLMAQIQSQTEQEGDPRSQDPLMALVTPPDLRTSVLDYGTRTSIPYRQVTVASSLAASKATAQPPTRSGSSVLTQRNGPVLTTTPLDIFPPATLSTSSTLSISAPPAPAPIETTSNASIRSTVDAIFKESFNSGFAATSGGATLQPPSSTNLNSSVRRQTIAAPVPVSYTTLPLTNSRNIRNSIGPGLLRSSVRSSAPDTSDRSSTTVPGNSRLSLLGSSAFRRTLYPGTGSSSQTTGANNATSSTPSTTASQPALPKTTTPGSIPPSPARGRGLTRPQGHSMGSVGRPSLGRLSLGAFDRAGVPVTTPPNREHTHDSQLDTHLAPASASSSTFYSDEHHTQFRTPSDRHPPPAPRLGYHSDTLMTQSSLGLNHDGFASGAEFDDFDRTRTTLASMGGSSGTRTRDMDLTVGASNAAAIVASVATNGFQPANPSHRSSGVTATVSLSNILTTQAERDDEEDEDDEDETGDMSRSPCPPGRTFRANTDLRSVAQAASSTSLGSESLFRPSTEGNFNGAYKRASSGPWDPSRR